MQNHICHFKPHPPKPGKGITHIDCIEESSRLPEVEAIKLRRSYGLKIYIDPKTGKWVDYVADRGKTHKEFQALMKNKVNALNEKRSLEEGGDPSATETWQHDVGLVEQNGVKFHEIKRIGGYRPLHMN